MDTVWAADDLAADVGDAVAADAGDAADTNTQPQGDGSGNSFNWQIPAIDRAFDWFPIGCVFPLWFWDRPLAGNGCGTSIGLGVLTIGEN